MADQDLTALFLDFSRKQLLEQYWPRLKQCVEPLSDEQIWWRPNEQSNSVGNLILHLTGNIRQWILAGLAGEAFDRDRPAEFAVRGPLPRDATVAQLESAVHRAADLIGRLDAAALTARHAIQGYEVSGLVAVFHVVEHFAGHTAQIVHITKTVRNMDLSVYDVKGRKQLEENGLP